METNGTDMYKEAQEGHIMPDAESLLDGLTSKPDSGLLRRALELPEEDFSPFYAHANGICLREKGRYVQLRAIIEFSNCCRRQCRYCGLRAGNGEIGRFRMGKDEILETAAEAVKAGYRTVILQSAEDPWYTARLLAEIVEGAAALGVNVTLSVGERTAEEYRLWKEAGAKRYLLKHETSDPVLYRSLHPCGTLEQRLGCLRELYKLGYEVGSGFMVGLPGQTLETIARDIMLLGELGCEMAGIGPFVPSPYTPLKDAPAGSPLLTKRAIALTRIVYPRMALPATTALSVIAPDVRDAAYETGADVLMKTVTPSRYRKHYEIYPSPGAGTKGIASDRRELEDIIRSLDRIPV